MSNNLFNIAYTPWLPEKHLLRLVFVVLLGAVIACNSTTSSPQSDENANTANDDTTTAEVKSLDSHLDILYLEEQKFRTLVSVPVGDSQHLKIIFQFWVRDSVKGSFTLRGWRSLRHDFPGNDVYLETFVKSNLDIDGKQAGFGNQKLGRRKIRRILSDLNESDTTEILVFSPRRANNFQIFYWISKLENKTSLDSIKIYSLNNNKDALDKYLLKYRVASTNPSPPASSDPSTNDPDISQ